MLRKFFGVKEMVIIVGLCLMAVSATAQDCDPDTTPPVITIDWEEPGPYIGECGVSLTLPSATAEDECDGAVPVAVSDLGGLDLDSPEVGV